MTLAVLAMPAGLYAAANYESLGLDRSFGIASLAIVLGFVVILVGRLPGALLQAPGAGLVRSHPSALPHPGPCTTGSSGSTSRSTCISSKGRALAGVLAVSLVVQALRTVVHYQVAQGDGAAAFRQSTSSFSCP